MSKLTILITVLIVYLNLSTSISEETYETGPQSFILKLVSPCTELEPAYEVMQSRLHPMTSVMDAFNKYGEYLCNLKFADAKYRILNSINDCAPHSNRPTRDLKLANSATKLVGVALTNFVKSEFASAANQLKDVLVNELKSRLVTETKRLLSSASERRPLEIKDVALVSETASQHEPELVDTNSNLMPRFPWALQHTLLEIIAGA